MLPSREITRLAWRPGNSQRNEGEGESKQGEGGEERKELELAMSSEDGSVRIFRFDGLEEDTEEEK